MSQRAALIIAMVFFAIAGLLAVSFVSARIIAARMDFRAFRIPTSSMEPVIMSGCKVLVNAKAYDKSRPSRGDIVVYEMISSGRRRLMCKRIAALPEELVLISYGRVVVNGRLADIPGLPGTAAYLNAGRFGAVNTPITVPEGHYYMLGDNSAKSFDSRQHGAVDARDIKGKYVFSYGGTGRAKDAGYKKGELL